MEELGHAVPLWTAIPFAVMLLGIAVLPLAVPELWEKNRNRGFFTAIVAAPIVVFLLAHSPAALLDSAGEYASFIALFGSLYVITGGIHLSGDLRATPGTNVTILAAGALLANLVGTFGASMLVVRMLLQTNRQRKHIAHVPFFFILTVSNCGGLLTPMGDPPLFLGYLRGVPFTWTLGLWPIWLGAVAYLITLFYVVDRRAYANERPADIARDEAQRVPLGLSGWVNVPLLAAVIVAIFLPSPWRELSMIALSGASALLGPRPAREANGFTYAPIGELAILFAGIFVTMVPALALLRTDGAELGLTEAWHFFLATGAFSSVLDNAPTYLTFLSTAMSLPAVDGAELVHLTEGSLSGIVLVAVSVGSVLMGANTYIGNGSNFMVKALAEEAGYAMPSFFGFALRALITLAPLSAAVAIYLALAG